tara:strand:- start:738 stop:1457 length:720 start_codon:yes stop_codon:yes gene_type:complete
MATGGWIKLHHKINDNDILDYRNSKNHRRYIVWNHILLSASYKKRIYKGVKLQPGEFTTSISALADRCGVSNSYIRSVLKQLTKCEMIAKKGYGQYTKITVINWERYQTNDIENVKGVQKKCKESATNKNKEKRTKKKESIRSKRTESLKTYFPGMGDEISDFFGKFTSDSITEFVETYPPEVFISCADRLMEYIKSPKGQKKGYKDYSKVLINLIKKDHDAKRYYENRQIAKTLNKYR